MQLRLKLATTCLAMLLLGVATGLAVATYGTQLGLWLVLPALVVVVACGVVGWAWGSRLLRPIREIRLASQRVRDGDLRELAAVEGRDEIARLAQDFNAMVQSLQAALGLVEGATQDISRYADEILEHSTQHSALIRQQAASLQETQTTVSEINQTSEQAATKAQEVVTAAQTSEEASRDGQDGVARALAGMGAVRERVEDIADTITDLSERIQQIGDIIASVNEIAEQSNILAINASIEAAKAGERGKGFAVVAVEMRNLAEQSKQATAQVRLILGEIQKASRQAVTVTEEGSRQVENGTRLANQAGEAIITLADVLQDSMDAAKQIAASAKQQSVGVDQITQAITDINQASASAVDGTRQIEQTTQQLQQLSQRLAEVFGKYEI